MLDRRAEEGRMTSKEAKEQYSKAPMTASCFLVNFPRGRSSAVTCGHRHDLNFPFCVVASLVRAWSVLGGIEFNHYFGFGHQPSESSHGSTRP